jgi:4-hydroxyphenylacetate 3-monooxygenase
MNRTRLLVGDRGPNHVADLLPLAAAQAAEADRTRTVSADLVAAIKASDVLALSATKELGGLEATVGQIAVELSAMASACASTAWCLWNHLCVFHLWCGTLGPDHAHLLGRIVSAREWVCFPGGAGSRVHGREDGDGIVLSGSAAFGSGCRYAEWTGVAFAMVDPETGRIGDPPDLRFSVVRLDGPGVRIDPTWDGASLRASATDDVVYDGARVPADRWARWFAVNRAEALRDPGLPMINHRYREDWIGISDLWLAAMAVGVGTAALEDAVDEVGGRRGIMGRPMLEFAGVHFNIGRAADALAAARALVSAGCAEVDARIDAGALPSEEDYLRQMSLAAASLASSESAMGLLRKALGGNGLRESHAFERRQRDLQAMPIHINAHEDRVAERVGRHLLGVEQRMF